jgi:hypothetical protein
MAAGEIEDQRKSLKPIPNKNQIGFSVETNLIFAQYLFQWCWSVMLAGQMALLFSCLAALPA